MSVLVVQEHKIVDESKEIGSEISVNGSKMFFSSATRNNNNAAYGGVGFLLDSRSKKH